MESPFIKWINEEALKTLAHSLSGAFDNFLATKTIKKRFVPQWLYRLAQEHGWRAFYRVETEWPGGPIGSMVTIRKPQRFVK